MRIEYQPTVPNSLNSSLTLDFSKASSDVQNVNTLLQNLLDKFYPKWDGFIFSNGAFSPRQPITKYKITYSSSTNGSTIDISDLNLVFYSGYTNNGYVKAFYSPDVKINFDNFDYTSITITGKVYHWECVATWECGLCDVIPTGFNWDATLSKTIFRNASETTTTDEFIATIPLENIIGEKYLCFRASVSGYATSRATTIYISSIKFNR